MVGNNINWMSCDKSDGIMIQGKNIKENVIKELILKYINEFVLCPGCHKTNSTMVKNKDLGKNEYKCLECGLFRYC